MDKEHVVDNLPAYALGALDEDEVIQVIRHLQGCAECRNELEAYQGIADSLGFAAPLVEPPPGLRHRILDEASLYQAGIRNGKRVTASHGQSRGSFPWKLAGALIIVLLAAGNLLLWRQVNNLRSMVVPSFQSIALDGTDLLPVAKGMLVISHNGKHGTLVVQDLPPLDESLEYQLWLIRDNSRISGGTFSVSSDGYASMWVSAPEPLGSYPSFGITIEPEGGSPGPTGDKVMGGEI